MPPAISNSSSTTAPSMAAHRLHRVWWRKGGRKMWAVLVIGFLTVLVVMLVFVFAIAPLIRGSDPRSPSFFTPDPATPVELTLVHNAQQKGAVCLDGSSPGYYLQRGWGSGSDSWLIYLEGGGWCNTVASCAERKLTALGSSYYMVRQVYFQGILSSEASENPDFFNWNKVKILYCDGGSFSGNVISIEQNQTTLYFRGQLIWEAVMDELLSKGLENAKEALLAGCSAGGLATFIHCNNFHALLPGAARVKCLSDGGYFLDSKDISGAMTIRSFFHDVVQLQDLGKNLPKDCVSTKEASQCFFPQEMVRSLDTPFFVLNSAYDWWQIQGILVPKRLDPSQKWLGCKTNMKNCDHRQLETLNGFQETMINALSDFQHKQGAGMFIDSCYAHCQTMSSTTWHSPPRQKINNKTIAQAVGDWYFDREEVKLIDCPYPCNPTCDHNILPYSMMA